MSEPKPAFLSVRLVLILLVIVSAFAGLYFAGLGPRRDRVAAVTKQTREDAAEAPAVTVAKAVAAPPSREILLPGTASALLETPIYARAEGYLKKLSADIGDVVKKDQVLVELDTPELDQQLLSARARLDQIRASLGQLQAAERQTQANLKLASLTVERWKRLVAEGVYSKQEGDDKQAIFEVRQAEVASAQAAVRVGNENIRAQQAEVARLEQLQAYKLVRAPYDGVITVRNCATGNLVSPNNQGRELFRIANNNTLRIFVALPQMNIPDVMPGHKAEVAIADRPNVKFLGEVNRTANSLDDATRTQRTEVRVQNRNNLLLPNMYVTVKFIGAKPRNMVLVPGDTLITRPTGTFVATVADGGVAQFQKVSVGRDLGAQVEVTEGLVGGENLIVNPPDSVKEGVRVRPMPRR